MDDDGVEDDAAIDDARAAVTDLVEKALLGGLLLNQRTRDEVRGWLTPDHFRSWTHSAVYRVLLDLEAAEDGDEAAAGRPQAVAERAASAPGVTAHYVSSLADACPRTDHVQHYAQLVVRAAMRRAVTEDAVRLAQAAECADPEDPEAVRSLAAQAEAARRTAAALADEPTLSAEVLSDQRRPQDPESASAPRPPSALVPMAGGRAAVTMTEALLRETELVAAVVRSPEALDHPEVRELEPQAFTHPACGALFAAARALADRGEALDELLVVAEADAVGPWTEEFGPAEARDVLAVSAGGDAVHLAALVRGHAAREDALRAAADIQAMARGVSVPAEGAAAPGRAEAPLPTAMPGKRVGTSGARRPVVVFVAGEAAAASATAVLVRDALRRDGRVLVELGRGFPPDHPLRQVVADAPDAAGRYEVAEQHVRASGLDAMVHTRVSEPGQLAAAMRRFRDAGYRVELAAVVVSEPQRHLAVLDAHLLRGVGGPPPEPALVRLADAMTLVEEQGLADTVAVLRPDGTALYLNAAERDVGWRRTTAAGAAIVGEAERRWSREESVRFGADYARVAARCGREQEGSLRTIAGLADRYQSDPHWRVTAVLAEQAVAAPPVAGSRPGERIKAAGAAGELTQAALDAELIQVLRNLSLTRAALARVERRAAECRPGAAAAGVGGGRAPVHLRRAADRADRADRAMAEDAAYYAEEARRIRARGEGLTHRFATLVREINRRSQLSVQQRAQEDWIRDGRAQARSRDQVAAVRRGSGRAPRRRVVGRPGGDRVRGGTRRRAQDLGAA